MNVLITGSNGLIGLTIVKYLSELNKYKVYGIDKDESPLYENPNCEELLLYYHYLELYFLLSLNILFHK